MPRDSISPTDADFIIFLILAVIFDALDILLNIIEFFIGGIPVVSSVFDVMATAIFGYWMHSVGKEVQSAKDKIAEIKDKAKEKLQSQKGNIDKAAKSTIKKQTAGQGVMKKVMTKVGGSFLIELIPFISLLPMWSFNVISVLGKETKKTFYFVLIGLVIFTPVSFLVVSQLLYVAPTKAETLGSCGFDQAKLATYEDKSKPPVAFQNLLGQEAKNYAINTLGVEAAEIPGDGSEEAMADLIRAEVANQWSKLSEEQKHGCSQVDAERGVLTYALGENPGLGHFKADGTPHCEGCNYSKCMSGTSGTLQPLSVTCDKYYNSYNQEVAAFWDKKYTIYLGVRENIGNFTSRATTSECQARWEQTWDITFGGSGWNWVEGSRKQTAIAKAAQYATEEYKCDTGKMAQVPLLKQAALPWGPMPFGHKGTYGSSGCGPTSLTMVINYFTGKNLPVNEIGQTIVNNGWRAESGTSWAAMTGIPPMHGLNSKATGKNWATVEQCFKNGGVAIASMSNCQFTGGGHFIVLTGVSGSTVSINDPGGRNITQAPVSDVTRCSREIWCINNK